MEQNFGFVNLVLIQDTALLHVLKAIKGLLWWEGAIFVRSNFWPNNSSDLKLLDYILWIVFQVRTNDTSYSSINSLKGSIVHATQKIKMVKVTAIFLRNRSRMDAASAQKSNRIEL